MVIARWVMRQKLGFDSPASSKKAGRVLEGASRNVSGWIRHRATYRSTPPQQAEEAYGALMYWLHDGF